MKKIGILTFHNAYNYGAVLQCYALNRITNNNIIKSEIINYNNLNIANTYKYFPKNKNNRSIKKYIKGIIKFLLFNKKIKVRKEAFNQFISKNCKLTKEYTIDEMLKNRFKEYDCLITGSDQVWSIPIVGELSDIYTLNIGRNNINRISYAASVGQASLIKDNQELYARKLSQIDHLSVREYDAKQELEKIIDKHIEVVMDPTLLLARRKWEELIINNNINENIEQKYILAYVVEPDEEYVKIVNDLSKRTNFKIIHFGLKNLKYKNVLKSVYTSGPIEFINYIKNAEYVVATSFHATVFSIIFNKNFFVIPHKKTGARVTNLLQKLGIEGRVFNTFEEFKNIDYSSKINWNEVNKKLEIERKKSINWLTNAINDEKEE